MSKLAQRIVEWFLFNCGYSINVCDSEFSLTVLRRSKRLYYAHGLIALDYNMPPRRQWSGRSAAVVSVTSAAEEPVAAELECTLTERFRQDVCQLCISGYPAWCELAGSH